MTALPGPPSPTSPTARRASNWAARGGLAGAVIAFWAIAAVQSVAWRFYVTNTTENPVPLDFIVRAEALVFGIAALLTPGIFWAARRFPLARGTWAVAIPVHLAMSVLFGMILKGLWDVAMMPLYRFPWTQHFTWAGLMSSLLAGLQANLLRYWIAVIGIMAVDQARRNRQTALEAANLRAQLAEAQLQILRIQIDPHYLFNTLHSISSLVHTDPDTAELMIANLSDLLRLSLERREKPEVPLADELEFLRLYLDIQCKRFGERLRVRYEIEPDAVRCVVPAMILQPLAENAIRHAIGCRRTGGWLRISARVEGPEVRVEVEDGGGAPPVLPLSDGVGMRNTRERLECLYPARHTFEVRAGAEGLLVRVRVPYHVAEQRTSGNRNAS